MSQYTENEVNRALDAVANGLSTKAASREWGVPRSTFQNRLKGIQPRDTAFSDLQQLSISQEAKLASWVQIQADLGLAPTHQQIREFAQRGRYPASRKEMGECIHTKKPIYQGPEKSIN
ncbi:transposase [Colletotrichum incanum]|nr:transposase [Colletotrichum incanum]